MLLRIPDKPPVPLLETKLEKFVSGLKAFGPLPVIFYYVETYPSKRCQIIVQARLFRSRYAGRNEIEQNILDCIVVANFRFL